ncbi:MAG: hypothetical protein JWN88_2961 [Frankiales bacterium]|nr:hypothetical protein [Frankiales bacterium]
MRALGVAIGEGVEGDTWTGTRRHGARLPAGRRGVTGVVPRHPTARRRVSGTDRDEPAPTGIARFEILAALEQTIYPGLTTSTEQERAVPQRPSARAAGGVSLGGRLAGPSRTPSVPPVR